MLTPLRYVRPPDTPPYRTRAEVSGTMAHGVVVPALHAYLVRARPCVCHTVEVGSFAGTWESVDPATLTGAGAQILVPVRWSSRARRAAVAIHYRSSPGATLAVAAATMAAAVLDAGWTWAAAGALVLPSTRDLRASWPAPVYTWRDSIVWGGDVEETAGAAAPRTLDVSAAAGTVAQIVVTPSVACAVLSVSVWEIADPEVTP